LPEHVPPRGASVVAHYGPKDAALAHWLRQVQRQITAEAGGAFRPRPIVDIHFTVLGLEFAMREVGPTDIDGLMSRLRNELTPPLVVQFGGWHDDDRDFLSRGRTLRERTFSVDGENCVVIGWPIERRRLGGMAVKALAGVRRAAEDYGFRHRYHAEGADDDPDAYMVIGMMPSGSADNVAEALRHYLSGHPITLSCGVDDISVVIYKTTELSWTTSSPTSLATFDTAAARHVADAIRAAGSSRAAPD
jgi:hypothetical protein